MTSPRLIAAIIVCLCFWSAANAKEIYAVKLATVEKTNLITLEIDFFGTAPTSDVVERIVLGELQIAALMDLTNDIGVQTYLNENELTSSRYGEPQIYRPSAHRFLTLEWNSHIIRHLVEVFN